MEFEHIKAEVESIDEAGVSVIDTRLPNDDSLYRLVARFDMRAGDEEERADSREGQYLISLLFHALNNDIGAPLREIAAAEVIEYMGPAV